MYGFALLSTTANHSGPVTSPLGFSYLNSGVDDGTSDTRPVCRIVTLFAARLIVGGVATANVFDADAAPYVVSATWFTVIVVVPSPTIVTKPVGETVATL